MPRGGGPSAAALVAAAATLLGGAAALRMPMSVRPEEEEIVNLARVKQSLDANLPRPKLVNAVDTMLEGPMCYDGDNPGWRDRCYIQGSEACPLSKMKKDEMITVYPGGRSRCLDADQPDFAFEVNPGDPSKLLFFFDGGGAEWDAWSTMVEAANKSSVSPIREEGFLKKGLGSERNPFRDYTTIFIQYCSGDLHGGNKIQPYRDRRGNQVVQVGYHNTLSAVEWAKANLRFPLRSLVITGVSAGAIASEVWSFKLLRELEHMSARVLADSYVPVFPHGFQGKVFHSLGVCDTDLLHDKLKEMCMAQQLTIEDVFDAAIAAHPEVGFGAVTSSSDWGQMWFYKLAAISAGQAFHAMTFNKHAFNQEACGVLRRYHENPNFVSYVMDSNLHMYSLCSSTFDLFQDVDGVRVMFIDWVDRFVNTFAVKSVYNLNASNTPLACQGLLNKKVLFLQ